MGDEEWLWRRLPNRAWCPVRPLAGPGAPARTPPPLVTQVERLQDGAFRRHPDNAAAPAGDR